MGSIFSTEHDKDLTILKNIKKYQKELQQQQITLKPLLVINYEETPETTIAYDFELSSECNNKNITNDSTIQELIRQLKEKNKMDTDENQTESSTQSNILFERCNSSDNIESTTQLINDIINNNNQKGGYIRIKPNKTKYCGGGNKLDYCGHINQQKINHVDIDLANF